MARSSLLTASAEIAESLSPLGFKFAKSGPHTQRKDRTLTFRVAFQSGRRGELWIYATVLSKRLAAWRVSQPRALGRGDFLAGGLIGNLAQPRRSCEWNLEGATAAAAIKDATSTVHSIALPYFERFADVSSLCASLERECIPELRITRAIEFLLCFADRPAAERALARFLGSRPDLLGAYHAHLGAFTGAGLPAAVDSSHYSYELAFATVAYGLSAPAIRGSAQ